MSSLDMFPQRRNNFQLLSPVLASYRRTFELKLIRLATVHPRLSFLCLSPYSPFHPPSFPPPKPCLIMSLYPFLVIFTVIFSVYAPPPPLPLLLSLHAQAPPSSDLIVGSVLTTSGLGEKQWIISKRFLDLLTPYLVVASATLQYPDVEYSGRTFYPFHYHALERTCHDIVIVEGYVSMLPAFVNEIRR